MKIPLKLVLYMHTLGGVGIQRAFINLAEGFLRRGIHDLWLIVNRGQGPYLKCLPSGVKLIDLRDPVPFRLIQLLSYLKEPQVCSPLLRSVARVNYFILKGIGYLRQRNLQFLLRSSLLCLKLADHLRFIQPDALLSVYICNIPTLLLKRFGFVGEARVTISEQDIVSAYLSNTPEGGVILRLMSRLYPQAHNIVAVSQGVAEDLSTLIQLSPDRVTVIYNPVITPNLLEQALAPLTHPWFEREQPPVILGAGRLSLQKDFSTLLRAFALVRQHRPARLVILGEGEERANLERLAIELGIQNDVSMPGFVDNPFAFMAKASVFVLSSAWEGFGNVLVEALACGCPVVATDCRSGPREILDNGRYGRLVPVADYEALAKAILETLDNPDFPADRQTRIQRAMEFSVDAAVDKYLKVLLD